jgi:hypothetical protein
MCLLPKTVDQILRISASPNAARGLTELASFTSNVKIYYPEHVPWGFPRVLDPRSPPPIGG